MSSGGNGEVMPMYPPPILQQVAKPQYNFSWTRKLAVAANISNLRSKAETVFCSSKLKP